nr:DoxX family protein [uncultured Halomonas sp.]
MLNVLHNEALGKLILRLSVGLMVLLHGMAKLANPASMSGIGELLAAYGLPEFLAYGVLVGEILAPAMLILGWQTRIGGLLVSGNMLVAIILAHSQELFALTGNGGWALELQGMFLFGALAIMFLGSGRLAVRPD